MAQRRRRPCFGAQPRTELWPGLFAGIRAYKDANTEQLYVFRLDDHVQRMHQSARILFLAPKEDLFAVTTELLRRNQCRQDTYVRALLMHNSNALSPELRIPETPELDPETTATSMFCLPLGKYLSGPDRTRDEAQETNPRGIAVCVSSWRRVKESAIPARAKPSAAYLNSALARKEAKDNGYVEAILLTEEGQVSEGSAEHVFIVRNGKLVSPPSSADNLDGITRRSIIAFATEDLGIPFEERPIGRTELYVADEIFLCGTGAEVTPVASVDRRVLGDGRAGAITQKISQHYEAIVRAQVPHRRPWLTPVWDVSPES